MALNRLRTRLRRKICVWLRKLTHHSALDVSQHERYALSIVRKLVADSKCELYLHPNGEKRYMKSDDHSLYVTINGNPNEINFINHQYSYNIKLGERTYNNVVDAFDGATKIRREEMEREFNSNIKHSLKNICSNFNSCSNKMNPYENN